MANRLRFENLSRGYIRQARYRLDSAARALQTRNHAYCVRLSQEAVELSTKGLLRALDVEYPKFHDTAPPLRAVAEKLPPGEAETLAKVSEALARKRALAMYGDEGRNLGPDDIFRREDAIEALAMARGVFKSCAKLIPQLTKGTRRRSMPVGGHPRP